jgi:AcrR family transcriptional regulator
METELDAMTQIDATLIDADLVDGAAEASADLDQPKLGRKRDHTRDPEILEAALDVLAETGYAGMTIDMVAARAKAGKATVYRRWASKSELVLDAVSCMKREDVLPENLPDTGTLRGDLVAGIKTRTIEEGMRKMRIMAGLMSMISQDPELADVARESIIEPRAAVNRMFFKRAIDRGEISADVDIETLALVSQSMGMYRMLVQRQPMTPEFLISIVDGVILPAVGIHPKS